MSKNGLYDLQFGHNMYYDGFNQFKKKSAKFVNFFLFFCRKLAFFQIFGSVFLIAFFGEKFMRFQENGLIHLIFGINVPWGTYHKVRSQFVVVLAIL